MNNIDILEEKEKKLRAYLAVLNEENILYKKEDAIEGIIKLFETLIAENKELKEEKREVIFFCKKDLAFKKRLEEAKETIDDYNMGRFDTSESVLNILEG